MPSKPTKHQKSSRTTDRSTNRSDWVWDAECKCWVSCRLNSAGIQEWDTQYEATSPSGGYESVNRAQQPYQGARQASNASVSPQIQVATLSSSVTSDISSQLQPSPAYVPISQSQAATYSSSVGNQAYNSALGKSSDDRNTIGTRAPSYSHAYSQQFPPVQAYTTAGNPLASSHLTYARPQATQQAILPYPPTGPSYIVQSSYGGDSNVAGWQGTYGQYHPVTVYGGPQGADGSSQPPSYSSSTGNYASLDDNQLPCDFGELRLDPAPQPEPQPIPCNQGGCEMGPQHNPAYPEPRPPPIRQKRRPKHKPRRSKYRSKSDSESESDALSGDDPSVKNPCRGGCEFGPRRDPDGPSPRPPPSGSSNHSKSHTSSRDKSSSNQRLSNSNEKYTSESSGRHRNARNKVNEGNNAIDETDTETETDKEFEKWEKERETWKDVTCACGFGYYTLYAEWVSGEDVRAGKAPPKHLGAGLKLPFSGANIQTAIDVA